MQLHLDVIVFSKHKDDRQIIDVFYKFLTVGEHDLTIHGILSILSQDSKIKFAELLSSVGDHYRAYAISEHQLNNSLMFLEQALQIFKSNYRPVSSP